jgi:2-oxoglutarate ferredoxin oxidoreductase subunit alpha
MRLGAGTYFMQGNEACVEGAIAAGLRFFAGYPITPSTEIAERLAERLPKEGGIFIQMEDEIASISAAIGSSWVGAKAMTATSGPGFSLMQENIGYAAMTETPLVIVNVMRGGPSTGLPTMPSQGDVMQAKYGSHGDYEIIALSPATVQDMFDLTIKAFNFSETYRVPAIILSDAEVGHMRGKFTVPKKFEVQERRMRTDKVWHDGFAYDESLVPRFPVFGRGSRVHVTGISHDIAGYPRTDPEVHEELVRRLSEKIIGNRDKISLTDIYNEDSDRFIVTYGSPTLPAMEVIGNDPSIGLLQLKTLWPMPEEAIRRVAKNAQDILVIEMNMGQVFKEVQRIACLEGCRSVRLLSKVGGEVHTPLEIIDSLRRC